jgi:DNA-binding response OmpR family regulator
VVEDNDDVRSYCVDALRELGYDVLHAADGRTALDMLDREPRTAIMFADIGLPGGMSGRQLATQALRRSAGLKVLLTSGYAHQADDATRSVDTDVEVLMKPFTFNALAERIRGIADRPPIALT